MIDQDDIRRIIPLREPALHIDRVTLLEADRIVARKSVSVAEPCYPLPPGDRGFAYPVALLLESFAQAGVVLSMSVVGDPALIPVIGRIAHARVLRRVVPGETITHTLRVRGRSGASFLLSGESTVEGEPVLTVDRLVISVVTAPPRP